MNNVLCVVEGSVTLKDSLVIAQCGLDRSGIQLDRPTPPQRAGVIDHMAFTARDLRAVKARFDQSGTKYDLRQQAGAGTWQLFCYDPNGAKVELDFDPSETLQ